MKSLAATLLCLAALASPALAQSITFDLPNLTYPPAPAPVSQSCHNPASLGTPACTPAR